MARPASPGSAHLIELKLRNVQQLFNSMDPSPFSGRASLLIGLGFLAACLFTSAFIARHVVPFGDFVREGLLIVGWVAMWRPMEIYLYDWWPVRRQERNYTRLSTMPIEVQPRPAQ